MSHCIVTAFVIAITWSNRSYYNSIDNVNLELLYLSKLHSPEVKAKSHRFNKWDAAFATSSSHDLIHVRETMPWLNDAFNITISVLIFIKEIIIQLKHQHIFILKIIIMYIWKIYMFPLYIKCSITRGHSPQGPQHYSDVKMGMIASQITSLTIVYLTVYSGADQRKHQSSASLAFVWGIHRGPVNSPPKWPVMRKVFPFDDVIMKLEAPLMKSQNILSATILNFKGCGSLRHVPLLSCFFQKDQKQPATSHYLNQWWQNILTVSMSQNNDSYFLSLILCAKIQKPQII